MTIPRAICVVFVCLALPLLQPARPAAQVVPPSGGPAPTPVLVELFTSEGCSSCPPADAALGRLIADQPVAGAQVIGLEEHVDYWNQSGWRDPFSSARFTARQSTYDTRVFHIDPIYTPQAIVDGAMETVGSRIRVLEASIASAASALKARITLSLIGVRNISDGLNAPSSVHVVVDIPPALRWSGHADLMLAITEDGLSSAVTGGENRNRDLRHSGVVRSLKSIARINGGVAPIAVTRPLALQPGWVRSHLHVVAFLQDRASERVLGSGAIDLADRPNLGWFRP